MINFQRSYERYLDSKYVYFMYLIILVHLLLPLIEEPASFEVPYWLPCCIEIFFLVVYVLRWLHAKSFQTGETFNKDKNFVILVVVCLIFVDLIAFVIVKAMNLGFAHRFTRALRVLIYINLNEGKELRRAMRNVRKTIPDIFNVFSLFFISLMIFAFVGWQLFKGKL